MGKQRGNGRLGFATGQCIMAVRCTLAEKCPSAWAFGMCSFSEHVFADVFRIWTGADAYRNVYPHKGRRWDYPECRATAGGTIWLMYGLLCQYMLSGARRTGCIW